MTNWKKSNSVSRRSFAAVLAGTGAAAPLLAQQITPQTAPPATPAAGLPTQGASPQRPDRPPEIPPFQDPIEFSRHDVAPKLRSFAMTQVRLLPGPFQEAQEWNRGYMSRLPADRLTRNFLLNAGLSSSAEPLGGWEQYVDPAQPRKNQDGELRGHFTGHFLSASAQLWASTGDKEAKAKGDEMVDTLAKCQAKLGAGGYLSAFPLEFFDRLDARRPVWAPFYTIHKIMAGMFDMYQYAGNKQALEVVSGMADWADRWTAPKTEEHMQDILRTEYGGMGEVLYNLAAETGNDKWAKAGDRYSKKSFFNPLALRRDELRGLHVNTHIPQVISAARRYEISGDVRFHDVADFFWDEVVSARSYVTEGTSNAEGWQSEPRQLAWELRNTDVRNGSQPSPNTAECCCAYNMLKLTRHLYSWTGQPRYFDYYERSLLNHRLGTIEPGTGHTEYYLSLALNGARKNFNSDFDDFWCCTGTGRRIFEAQRQHLLARRTGALREPVHRLRTELGREGFQAAAGHQIPPAAGDVAGGDGGDAGGHADSPARAGLAGDSSGGEGERKSGGCFSGAGQLSDAGTHVEDRRSRGGGITDAPFDGIAARRSLPAGIPLWPGGVGCRSRSRASPPGTR